MGDTNGGGGGGDVTGMTPEQAKAEITKLATDAEFQKVYMNKEAVGQPAAALRMKQLYEKAGALMGAARA